MKEKYLKVKIVDIVAGTKNGKLVIDQTVIGILENGVKIGLFDYHMKIPRSAIGNIIDIVICVFPFKINDAVAKKNGIALFGELGQHRAVVVGEVKYADEDGWIWLDVGFANVKIATRKSDMVGKTLEVEGRLDIENIIHGPV